MGMVNYVVIGNVVVDEFKVANSYSCNSVEFFNRFLRTLSKTEKRNVCIVDEYSFEYCDLSKAKPCQTLINKYEAFVSQKCEKVFVCEFGYITSYYYKGYTIDVENNTCSKFPVHITFPDKEGWTAEVEKCKTLEEAINNIDYWLSF